MRRYRKKEIEYFHGNPDNNLKGVENEEIIFFDFEFPKHSPIYIQRIGITPPNPRYEIIRHNCEINTIEFVISGKGTITASSLEGPLNVGKNDVYFLFEGENHHYWSNKKDPLRKIWINFKSDSILTLFKNERLRRHPVVNFPELKENFVTLFNMVKDLNTYEPIIVNNIYYEVVKIVTECITKIEVRDRKIPLENKILNLLEESIYSKAMVQDFSATLNITPQHLNNVFISKFKISPYQYLMNRKVDEAKNLLQTTDLTISEISAIFKFDSCSHFSKIFKKKMGISPKEFREKNK